jgi:hypothetical protein
MYDPPRTTPAASAAKALKIHLIIRTKLSLAECY